MCPGCFTAVAILAAKVTSVGGLTAYAVSKLRARSNPNTLVPVLVGEHQTLWETDAIVCRLAQLAKSPFWRMDDRLPQMMMWISWSTHHFTLPASSHYFERIVRPTFSDVPEDPQVLVKDMAAFRKYAAILDDQLNSRTRRTPAPDRPHSASSDARRPCAPAA
jgi:glutathione S-transferase